MWGRFKVQKLIPRKDKTSASALLFYWDYAVAYTHAAAAYTHAAAAYTRAAAAYTHPAAAYTLDAAAYMVSVIIRLTKYNLAEAGT